MIIRAGPEGRTQVLRRGRLCKCACGRLVAGQENCDDAIEYEMPEISCDEFVSLCTVSCAN